MNLFRRVSVAKPCVLIVDDEKSICDSLEGIFFDENWKSLVAVSGEEGLHKLKNCHVDLVLLDVWMDKMDGIQILQMMRDMKPDVPIVVMSGHGTIETAVKATKMGAFNFLEKPLSLEKLFPLMEYAALGSSKKDEDSSYQIMGESQVIQRLHRQIGIIAPRHSWVLISGENGTGKEVVARNIHRLSLRADKPFVAVNCAAIPEDLIESELFGHNKGAFTSAHQTKRGKFELAHQGTLFLDEIGDMSLRTQAKILRILQEQSFERVGGSHSISVDVRVIAATNKNLQAQIKAGQFREDLFYRLNVIPLHMRPLRERRDDIPILADYFLNKISMEWKETKKNLAPSAREALCQYEWPGNVRELKNTMERLALLIHKDEIEEVDLMEMDVPISSSGLPMPLTKTTWKEAKLDFEKIFILDKLREYDGNISKTAEAIGVERSHLHRKIRSYEIDLKKIKS
jgi:two-component system nitrogen regulation response regulator NtrX